MLELARRLNTAARPSPTDYHEQAENQELCHPPSQSMFLIPAHNWMPCYAGFGLYRDCAVIDDETVNNEVHHNDSKSARMTDTWDAPSLIISYMKNNF